MGLGAKIARLFIGTSLVFFIIGCVEGLMFPSKFRLEAFYAAVFHIPAEHIKPFFGYFVSKIHTHVNLVGWVGSALMGILYFVAPQIGGSERYSRWGAYGNWFCQTAGVALMGVGFHLIGIAGLSSGFQPGSPEFRQVAEPFKMLVSFGGVLIVISACLFASNIGRTLFAKSLVGRPANAAAPKRRMPGIARNRSAAALAAVVFGLALSLSAQKAVANPKSVPESVPVVMVGDRLVDVAYHLGVLPEAMSVRCSLWPLCEKLNPTVQVLGCPACLLKKGAAPAIQFAEKHGIKRVLIEKSDPFCTYKPDLRLEDIAALLEEKGFDVQYVDFTRGLEVAVRKTAELLGRSEKADEILAAYEKEMEETKRAMEGRQFARKVAVIRGVYQPSSGKTFLRIEAPGGYADRFLLASMGCENVGEQILPGKKEASKGHVTVRKLDGLAKAAPDAIVMTGDSVAVQIALSKAIQANPSLADTPAIRNHAVFTLPGYVDGSVLEYPSILRLWATALTFTEKENENGKDR